MLLLQKNKTAKEKLMEISILFVILVSIFTIFKTVEVYKSNKYIGQENRNLISFSGEGEVFAVADVATFSFSVVEEAKTSSEALSKSAEKMNSVIDYLKEQNIAEKDIKTINYSVNPRYEWRDLSVSSIRPEGERVLIAYEANQTLSVKIRNTEKALGSPIKKHTKAEEEMYRLGRRGLVATCKIPKGTKITRKMIDVKRPGYGIHPKMIDVVVGRIARKDIEEDDILTWEIV